MEDPIWKNQEGKFLKVENITDREWRLLEWAGAKRFDSKEEFKNSQIIENGVY